MRFHAPVVVVALLGVFGVVHPTLVSAHTDIGIRFRFGTREHPFEGLRYDTMRSLAHYLDERASHAAQQAADDAHHGGRREDRFLDSIDHFARQAEHFHERLDRYAESPWDVPGEVDHLADDARRVNSQVRQAHVFEHTWEDWDAVVDVLDRMQRVIAGEDVDVPSAHRRAWRDHDREDRRYDNERDDDQDRHRDDDNWRDRLNN